MLKNIAAKARFLVIFILLSSIITHAQLKADFSASVTSGCAPLIVHFIDKSTGGPNSWKWDLGNGTISYLRSPSATYFNPGKKTIKLIIKFANRADSMVKVDYIDVLGKPDVKFGANDTTGCFPLPVKFIDSSTAVNSTINKWLWDFGDGFTSPVQNPAHTYIAAGNFNVTLQVKNTSGCTATLSKTPYIQINTGVIAKFTNNTPNTCTAPVTINFLNQSTGTGSLGFLWLFGDSSSSTDVNPSHQYNSTGSYTVSLIVTNSNGCRDTIVKPNAITLGQVSASFNTVDSACQNRPVIFSNSSVPNPAFVKWTFGDGTTSTLTNPSKTYLTTGTFTVKMIANFGACVDSITKTIQILPKPVVKFNGGDTNNCKAPFKVNFINQSSSGVTFFWDFGDGTTSNWQTPSHTYTNPGSFTVKLRVTNPNGCTDSLIKTNYIIIKDPVITFKNLPDSSCAPFTKNFSASIASTDVITSYLWNLGDSAAATSATPSHTYLSAGIYPISLIITTADGCSDTASIARGVITNSRPVANFSATPTNTCAKIPIDFKDLTTPAANRWLWNFGNGVTSTAQNPRYMYTDTGFFDITLIVWNRGCPDTIKFLKYIHINPPIAKYTVGFKCNKPYERVFTDLSVGADQWNWDFGDGTTSTLQSPVHIYANTGTFNTSLKVVNSSSGCDYITFNTIRVIDENPFFKSLDTVVCKGTTLNFTTNLSISNVANFDWRFGDSNITVSTNKNNQLKTYNQSGLFSVRLIITDFLGCKDTLVKPNYIRVNGPTAKFTTTTPGTCLNSTVAFNDSSLSDGLHPIQTWAWNYGDRQTDTLTAPPFQHTYQTPGIYSISLKVTDSIGCSDSSKLAGSIIISKPIANFKTTDTLICPGKQIQLKDYSIGSNLLYSWDFGDGTPASSAASPAHLYTTDGNFTIAVIVTDKFGCTDTATKTAYVKVVSPVSFFRMSDSVSNCPPLLVNFTDSSSNALTYHWDFGDSTESSTSKPSHFYTYPGNYTARQTVTGPGGCSQFTEKQIVIKGPRGVFTYQPLNGCNPVVIDFAASTFDKASIYWDFNDGTIQNSNDSTISYTYTYPGIYLPKMILVNDEGCQVPIRGKDTIVVNGITSDFDFLKNTFCDSGSVSFTDASYSNDLITGYNWTFGDGSTSTEQNPVYNYKNTGTNYPTLVVSTLHGCKDTLVSDIPIKIVATPKINIKATANGCTPLTVTYNSQLLVADTSAINWKWNLANGNMATLANPLPQNYTTAGIYDIVLEGTNSSGCMGTATKQIEAYAIPLVNAGPTDTILCKGTPVVLKATGALTYNWFPTTGLTCVTCASTTTTTYQDITYTVTGTSIHGCSAKDSIGIIVKNKFNITYSRPDTLCKGQTKKLAAAGAKDYSWTPATGLDNANISNPEAQPDTTTTYMVIGSDGVGCFKDTGFVPVKVYPYPTVEAGDDVKLNVGLSTKLTAIVSADVNYVDWQPTGNLFRNNYTDITVKPTQNTEYTVEVKNRGGCAARDRVTVFVICDGTNFFIPNTFSPNGDGVNEIFYPRGTGLFKIKNFKIFNRWGELMFEKNSFDANNPTYGWDGNFKGCTYLQRQCSIGKMISSKL
jgi:gliding motility-associated-like protein